MGQSLRGRRSQSEQEQEPLDQGVRDRGGVHDRILAELREEPKWKLATLALNRTSEVARRMELFKRFWFDIALSATPTTFPSLLAVADPGKVLFGSDFPFAPAAAVKYMRQEYESIDLSKDLRHGIDRGNAEFLFPRLSEALTA